MDFDGQPYWSLDASETGKSAKCPVGRGGGVKIGYFVLSPVSLASRYQYGGSSNSMMDIYVLTEK